MRGRRGGGPFIKVAPVCGALILPGKGCGGFCVAPNGRLAVAHTGTPEGAVFETGASYAAQQRRAGLVPNQAHCPASVGLAGDPSGWRWLGVAEAGLEGVDAGVGGPEGGR